MQAQQENSSTQIQKEVGSMKHQFKTNWQICNDFLPSMLECEDQAENTRESQTTKPESLSNNKFEELLLKVIDEELSSFGNCVKKKIYLYLNRTYKIRRQDIPCKISEFTDAIERIFGIAAKFLEIRMMKRFYQKFGDDRAYIWEKDDLLFTEYLQAAKSRNVLGNTNGEMARIRKSIRFSKSGKEL